jgi:hypothetical protein
VLAFLGAETADADVTRWCAVALSVVGARLIFPALASEIRIRVRDVAGGPLPRLRLPGERR